MERSVPPGSTHSRRFQTLNRYVFHIAAGIPGNVFSFFFFSAVVPARFNPFDLARRSRQRQGGSRSTPPLGALAFASTGLR